MLMFEQQCQQRKAWENIMKAYENKSLTKGLSLLRSLFDVKLNSYRGMGEHVTKIMSIAQKLTDISSLVNDKFVSVIMLS
jgi:hypothetical protein